MSLLKKEENYLKQQKNGYYGAIAISFMTMFFIGGSNMLLPAVKNSLLEHYEVNLYAIGVLSMLNSVIGGVVPFFIGGLSDRFGRKILILCGSITLCIYFAIAPQVTVFLAFCIITLISGVANKMVDTAGMSILFDVRDNPASLLPLSQIFFTIGSIITPFLVSVLIERNYEWKNAYFIFSVTTVIMLICVIITRFPKTLREKRGKKPIFPFCRQPTAGKHGAVLLLLTLCNAALYNVISTWADIYMKSVFGYSDGNATKVFSIIQIGGMIGATCIFFISRKIAAPYIIRICPLAGTIVLITAIAINSDKIFIACMMLIGFFVGTLYSIIVGYAGMLFAHNAGLVAGAMGAAASTGNALSSYLAGRMCVSLGIRSVFCIIIICGIFSAVFAQIIYIQYKSLMKTV